MQEKFDEYVIKKYKKGINLKPLIKDLKDPKGTLKKPDDCDKPNDKVKMKKWERELDAYDNKVDQVEEISKSCTLCYGVSALKQCKPRLKETMSLMTSHQKTTHSG